MQRALTLSIFLLVATSQALAANPFPSIPPMPPTGTTGNHAHQGQATTLTTLSQWNIDNFTVKAKKTVTLGKTGSLSCGDPKGCVLRITAAVAVEVKNEGAFGLQVKVDGMAPNPQTGFAATCEPKGGCSTPYLGTVVVAQGTHKVAYFLATAVETLVLSWSGQAEMFGLGANAG